MKYEERKVIRTDIEIEADLLIEQDFVKSVMLDDAHRLSKLNEIVDDKISKYLKYQKTEETEEYCPASFEKDVRILTSLIGIEDKIMTLNLKQLKEVILRGDGKTNSGKNLAESIYGNAAERRRLVQEYNRRIFELASKRKIGNSSEKCSGSRQSQ